MNFRKIYLLRHSMLHNQQNCMTNMLLFQLTKQKAVIFVSQGIKYLYKSFKGRNPGKTTQLCKGVLIIIHWLCVGYHNCINSDKQHYAILYRKTYILIIYLHFDQLATLLQLIAKTFLLQDSTAALTSAILWPTSLVHQCCIEISHN